MATLPPVVRFLLSHLFIRDSTFSNLASKFWCRLIRELSISKPSSWKVVVQWSLRSLQSWSSLAMLVIPPMGITCVFSRWAWSPEICAKSFMIFTRFLRFCSLLLMMMVVSSEMHRPHICFDFLPRLLPPVVLFLLFSGEGFPHRCWRCKEIGCPPKGLLTWV